MTTVRDEAKNLALGDSDTYPTHALGGGGAMALSMDEQRMLAEIERRLADDDPVLAARLTAFRLPRLTFATRSRAVPPGGIAAHARGRRRGIGVRLRAHTVPRPGRPARSGCIPPPRPPDDDVGVQAPGAAEQPARRLDVRTGLGQEQRAPATIGGQAPSSPRQVSGGFAARPRQRGLTTRATAGSGTAPGSPGPSGRAGTHRPADRRNGRTARGTAGRPAPGSWRRRAPQ